MPPVLPTSLLRLIPLLPLAGFLLAIVLGRARNVVKIVAPACVGAALAVSIVAVLRVVAAPEGARLLDDVYVWIQAGAFRADVAFRIDALSAVMTLIVTGVGFLIHVYSVGYMEHDDGLPRFFAYLNLFMFAMLLLVLADNLLVLFVGWEGVGLCSYLLIGFWYEKDENAAAGKKAFIVNRIGDVGFVLGLLLLAWTHGRRDDHQPRRRPHRVARRRPLRRDRDRDRAAPPPRRHRQVGAAAALRLAPRRHGRPDAGLGADPRRDHGDRGHLHDRAPARRLRGEPRRARGGRRRSAPRPRSSRRRSPSSRPTSRRCSPTRP